MESGGRGDQDIGLLAEHQRHWTRQKYLVSRGRLGKSQGWTWTGMVDQTRKKGWMEKSR